MTLLNMLMCILELLGKKTSIIINWKRIHVIEQVYFVIEEIYNTQLKAEIKTHDIICIANLNYPPAVGVLSSG